MPIYNRKHIQQAFSKAAKSYDANAELQAIIRGNLLELAQTHWQKGDTILDIGCGTGSFAVEAETLQLNIIGLDLAYGMCVEAVEFQPTINASAEQLPFPDNSFDGCASCLMLQWAENPLIALKEMARVIKPGGKAIITSFTTGTLEELRQVMATLDNTPHVNIFYDTMALSTLATHAGFALLQAQEEGFEETYTDAHSLMRSIKAIGASNKQANRRKGLMTPSWLKSVEAEYRKQFGSKKPGLPASWNAVTLLLEKTA